MILANTRCRLRPADLQLVLLLLSRGSAGRRAALERQLEQEGPDVLLDVPSLADQSTLPSAEASGSRLLAVSHPSGMRSPSESRCPGLVL